MLRRKSMHKAETYFSCDVEDDEPITIQSTPILKMVNNAAPITDSELIYNSPSDSNTNPSTFKQIKENSEVLNSKETKIEVKVINLEGD